VNIYVINREKMIRYLTFTAFFFLSLNAYAQGSNAQENNVQNNNSQAQVSEEHPNTQATAADVLTSLKKAEQFESNALAPMLTGSAELGFLYKTGNSNSGDMKSGVDLHFENGRWRSLLNIDLLIKKADVEDDNGNLHFETIDQKWTFTSQTNYSLGRGEKNYVFGNVWYEDSKFNSFVSQSSISTGWGAIGIKVTSHHFGLILGQVTSGIFLNKQKLNQKKLTIHGLYNCKHCISEN